MSEPLPDDVAAGPLPDDIATGDDGLTPTRRAPRTWTLLGKPVEVVAVALAATLLLTTVTCLGFAALDFSYAESVPDKAGSAVWLIAGMSGAAALLHLIMGKRLAVGLCYVHLGLCCVLAFEVFLADIKSEIPEALTLVVPVLIFLGAVGWMYRLWRHLPTTQLTQAGKIASTFAAAAAAVVSLLTFWWTNEYLPRTTLPKVDLTAELVEVSRTDTVVHLAAKITVENKGALSVQPYASLMRITAYPPGSTHIAPTPEHIAASMDFDYPPSRDFRETPLGFEHRRLIYSDDFMGFTAMLAPGAVVSYQRIIDVDSKTYSRARLNVTASFFNRRSADVAETCGEQPVSSDHTDQWQNAVSAPIRQNILKPTPFNPDQPPILKTLCYDRHLMPRGAVDWLVSDKPRLRTIYVLESPCAGQPAPDPVSGQPGAVAEDPALSCPVEVPYVFTDWTSAKTWRTFPDTSKLDAAYPNITLPRSTELVLSEPVTVTGKHGSDGTHE
jgi:hypothetical protein